MSTYEGDWKKDLSTRSVNGLRLEGCKTSLDVLNIFEQGRIRPGAIINLGKGSCDEIREWCLWRKDPDVRRRLDAIPRDKENEEAVIAWIMEDLKGWHFDPLDIKFNGSLSDAMEECARFGAAVALQQMMKEEVQFWLRPSGEITAAFGPFFPTISREDIEQARREADVQDEDITVFAKMGGYHEWT